MKEENIMSDKRMTSKTFQSKYSRISNILLKEKNLDLKAEFDHMKSLSLYSDSQICDIFENFAISIIVDEIKKSNPEDIKAKYVSYFKNCGFRTKKLRKG